MGGGAAQQQQALDIVRGSTTRVLGPSSLGVANFRDSIFMTASAALEGKPLAVLVMPDAPQALAIFAQAGIAAFSALELCADAIAAIAKAGSRRRSTVGHLACGSGSWSRPGAANLESMGIDCVPEVLVDLDTSLPRELPFDYPVAVKAPTAEISHKSELGAVILGVNGADELQRALVTLRERVQGKGCTSAQLQPMVQGGVAEVLIGFRRDSEVGPVVTLAPGDVLAELSTQRSVRLASVSEVEAVSTIDELHAMRVFRAYRGRPFGDIDALATAIHKLPLLALEENVVEAEINPLIVLPKGQGAVTADFLARVAG